MHGCRLSLPFLLANMALLACCCADTVQGQSFGPWHLPSTTGQYWGHGVGAGHHAPMVRTPGCRALHVPRVAMMPARKRCDCMMQPLETMHVGCGAGSSHLHGAYRQAHPHPAMIQQPVIHQPVIAQPAPCPSCEHHDSYPHLLPPAFSGPPMPRSNPLETVSKSHGTKPKQKSLPAPALPTTDP